MPPALAYLLGYTISASMPGTPAIVTTATATILPGTTSVAVVRSSPSTTTLTLPSVALQGSIPLTIVDWSEPVTAHTIVLNPVGGDTIARQPSWDMLSNEAYLAVATLYPAADLDVWFVK